MVEFFADSLVNGFLQSSMMGKFIVMVQLSASIVMVGIIIGKVKQLAHVGRLTRRVSRDVMMGRDVLEYYLARHPSSHTAIENIYRGTCERLFNCFRRRRAPRLRMARARRVRRSPAMKWSW